MRKNQTSGQALVEYLFLFAFMSLIGVNLVRGFTSTMGTTSGSLAVILSNQLTSGVCEDQCFHEGFINQW